MRAILRLPPCARLLGRLVFTIISGANALTITEFISANRLTQKEFGDLVGASQGLVSQWLSGDTQITAERAKTIEEATKGAVKRHELRPDIFDAPRKRVSA